MDLQLRDKRALVTGSNSGLGEAIARLLAEEGAAVVVHGRDDARAKAVAESIRDAGGRAEHVSGDLATDGGAAGVADAALTGGAVDILVNNAGGYDQRSWAEATPDAWSQVYEQNVVSAVRMIRRLVPPMRERGWGRVVQIGGGLAVQPREEAPHYSATLAARHNLAVSLARDLKDSGVTSNVVAPGAILGGGVLRLLTELAPQRGWGVGQEEIERAAGRDFAPNDVGRLGRPEEVAAAVAYLAGPQADYISGATIRVDGGTIRCVQ